MTKNPIPTDITLDPKKRLLTIAFDDGNKFEMSSEYLRVNSPSAEVQGHGPGEGVLQFGKENVTIDAIEPVGSYAILLRFSDGHDTGIFAWDTLHTLGSKQDEIWQSYLEQLEAAGRKRHPPIM